MITFYHNIKKKAQNWICTFLKHKRKTIQDKRLTLVGEKRNRIREEHKDVSYKKKFYLLDWVVDSGYST